MDGDSKVLQEVLADLKIPFVLCLMMIDIHIIQGSCDSVLDDERLNSEGLGLQEVDLPANLTASAMQVSIAQT